MTAPVRFALGHGAGNDFVLLPDRDAALDLPAGLVRALCDRRTGLGADGVLRVVPAAAVSGRDGFPDVAPEDVAREDVAREDVARPTWAMDHRNADGTTAEMCGNGLRLVARYLVSLGWVAPGASAVLTRAGVRAVDAPADPRGDVTVDLGVVRRTPEADGTVVVLPDGTRRPGRALSVGNPHLVVEVDDLASLGPVLPAPLLEPADAFPQGVNVEHVVRVGPGHVAVRVHERGVGETLACGTGAGAVAVAVGQPDHDGVLDVRLDLPGGRLRVRGATRADGATEVRLSGPAVLLASGELDEGWVAAAT